jgi:hypothetical protein
MARPGDFVVLLMSDVHSLFGDRTLSRGEEGEIKQKETKVPKFLLNDVWALRCAPTLRPSRLTIPWFSWLSSVEDLQAN